MPWADVDLNKKDFTGNLVLTDRFYVANELAQYPALEYPATPPIRGVAYRRGVTVTYVWTLRNDNDFRLVGTLTLQGARLKSPGPNTEGPPGTWSNPDEFRTLGYSPTTTAIDLAPNGGSQNVTVTLLGVPNHVCLGDIELKYDLPLQNTTSGTWGNNGTSGNYAHVAHLYVVDAQPTGLQSVPWADFLEYTCRWAWGAVGPTDLKEKMTRGMHYSNRSATHRVYYNPAVNNYFVWDPGSDPFPRIPVNRPFALGWLTLSLDTCSPAVFLDCRDFAGTLTLATASHGTDSFPIFLEDLPANNANGFVHHFLCPAGYDWTNPANYATGGFNFHVIVGSGFETFDASCSYLYDSYGATYLNPPVFWHVDPHWQNWVGNSAYGLVLSVEAPWLPRPLPTITFVTP